MKIYVISDTAGFGVPACNQINKSGNLAVMSELNSDNVRSILTELKNSIGSSYDLFLVICDNAKDTGIEANKMEGVRAAVCKDSEDAMEVAASTSANVVVVDSTKLDKRKLASILDGLLGADKQATLSGGRVQQRPTMQEPPAAQHGASLTASIKSMLGLGEETEAAPAERAKAARTGPTPARAASQKEQPGFMAVVRQKGWAGAIRDALGLE